MQAVTLVIAVVVIVLTILLLSKPVHASQSRPGIVPSTQVLAKAPEKCSDTVAATPECIAQCACSSSGCTYLQCTQLDSLPEGCCCPQHPAVGSMCGVGTTETYTTMPTADITHDTDVLAGATTYTEFDSAATYRNTGRRGRSPLYSWRINPSQADTQEPVLPTLIKEQKRCIESCYTGTPTVGWRYLETDGIDRLSSCMRKCEQYAVDLSFEEVSSR